MFGIIAAVRFRFDLLLPKLNLHDLIKTEESDLILRTQARLRRSDSVSD